MEMIKKRPRGFSPEPYLFLPDRDGVWQRAQQHLQDRQPHDAGGDLGPSVQFSTFSLLGKATRSLVLTGDHRWLSGDYCKLLVVISDD
jgi:hypothetical protein